MSGDDNQCCNAEQCKGPELDLWPVLYMDADAFVTDLSIPLSTMLKIARFTSKYSLMLARDPPEDVTLSKAGVPNVNTGFIVVRNHTAARETLEAVLDCLETIPECEYLKRDWPHEGH